MSKEKKQSSQPAAPPAIEAAPVDTAPPQQLTANGVPVGSVVPLPVQKEKLLETDRLTLELARQQRQTALAEARTALANNEKSELAYKYIVLQLYMKYGLTDADAISETGDIIRGGALAPKANS